MRYYHTTTADRGKEFLLESGEFYEQIKDGVPQISTPGDYTGFKKSQTPQVSASKSPESSLFAAAQDSPTTFYIYSTEMDPDIDLSGTVVGDFALLEEVRYNHPEDSPIPMQIHATVTVPERAINDISLTYAPPGANIIKEWGQAIKNLLAETLLRGEPYPSDAETVVEPARPDPEPYQLEAQADEVKEFIDSAWSESRM